jgi:uncharacterized protein (TIGR02466 family)
MTRTINYSYYHWGPFLYRTCLEQEELNKLKKLCSKKSPLYRESLAGLIKHEHTIEVKEIFPIISPYIESYAKAYIDYTGKNLGPKIELKAAWVNFMTKYESNPLHTHHEDLSFVIYTKVPKELKQEHNENEGNTSPGAINFVQSLDNSKYLVNTHIFMPEVGDFFIFPACLNHGVNHFQSKGERISISGNLRISNGEKI